MNKYSRNVSIDKIFNKNNRLLFRVINIFVKQNCRFFEKFTRDNQCRVHFLLFKKRENEIKINNVKRHK